MFQDKETLWVIHIGENDRLALRAVDEGFVCIGWLSLGDLSSHTTRESIRAAMEGVYPTQKPRTISSWTGQVYRFVNEIAIGDPVVLPVKPTGEIALGRVKSNYRFASDDADLFESRYCNIREIEWLKVLPRTAFSKSALHSFGSFLTVSTSSDYLEDVRAVLTAGESKKADIPALEENDEGTPSTYEIAAQETEDYLLKAWRNTGASFEHVVAAVFRALGYSTEVTPPSGDHGVDVVAHPDPLGIETPYIKVQVKSGTSAIGEPEVNQLKGAVLDGEKGILISLGRFTSGAEAAARAKSNITLIDAKKFVGLFLDHYEQLEPDWRAKFPLRKTFVPTR
jgi:restriction system protein